MDGDYNYGLKFQNYPAGGGCIYSNNGSSSNITIKHIECTGTQQTGGDDQGGIYINGSMENVEIAYNYIHGPSPGYWYVTGITVWNGAGTDQTNLRIHHNRVSNLHHDGIKSDGNFSIFNNEVSGIQGSGHSDSILCQSGSNCYIYDNFIHDSSDQNIYIDNLKAVPVNNIYIYNNVIDSPAGFGVVLDPEGPDGDGVTNGLNNVHIYNNTFYRSGGPNIRYGGRGSISNIYIKNNIFGKVSNANDPQLDLTNVSMADSNSYDYNVYMTGSSISPYLVDFAGSRRTLSQLQGMSPPREVHGKYSNPLFVSAPSNLHLSFSDTVAKNSGIFLSTYFTKDKDDVLRPQGPSWDIGAYEYKAKIPLPPVILQIN